MLNVDQVSLEFDGLKAVDNVSLHVKKGSVTALIGPNGAGKTTLFNIIAGVYTPKSGDIYLDGKKITGKKTFEICNEGIARTYQVIKLFSGMTVLENVLVGMHSRLNSGFWQGIFKTKKARVEETAAIQKAHELLELVGLDKYAAFPAGSLAYGQQRLLEIARALASSPQLLLLDEPAAGMNSSEKMELNKRIQSMVGMGITVLIVEHDMAMVMSIADKIYVINSGKYLAQGSAEEIANNPAVIEAYLGRGDI